MTQQPDQQELEKLFLAQQVAMGIIKRNRGWWHSASACLSAGSLLFLALLLIGWLTGWWTGGWQLGIVVVITLILAISGSENYSRSKKNDS